jgi:hypothetical protein
MPVMPDRAKVETLALSATLTVAADVSMKPPLPPTGALASSVPARLTVPVFMSPSSMIVPPRFCNVRASTMPVLLTAVWSRSPAPCAVITTLPPSARISPPLRTSAPTAPLSTATLSSPSPATSSVIASPPASTTVPKFALIVPPLPTFAPSSAT